MENRHRQHDDNMTTTIHESQTWCGRNWSLVASPSLIKISSFLYLSQAVISFMFWQINIYIYIDRHCQPDMARSAASRICCTVGCWRCSDDLLRLRKSPFWWGKTTGWWYIRYRRWVWPTNTRRYVHFGKQAPSIRHLICYVGPSENGGCGSKWPCSWNTWWFLASL